MEKNDEGLFSLLTRLYSHIPAAQKKRLFALLALMVVGGVAELISLGAVIPFLSVIANADEISNIPFLGEMVGSAQLSTRSAIIVTAIIFVVVALVSAGIRIGLVFFSANYVHKLGNELGVKLYSNVICQKYAWHLEHNSANVLAAIDKVTALTRSLIRPLMKAVVSFIIATAIIVGLMMTYPSMAILAAGGFAAAYWVIARFLKIKLKSMAFDISRRQVARTKSMQEGIGGIRDIILDRTQPLHIQAFSQENSRLMAVWGQNDAYAEAPRYVMEVVAIGLIVTISVLLTFREGGVAAALPTLGLLALGGQKLIPHFQTIYSSWVKARANVKVLGDVLGYLSLATDRQADPLETLSFKSDISLRDVAFRYADGLPEVLTGINLKIKKGQRVGFKGETGSGKTTLLDILMALISPVSGALEIDGVAIDERNAWAWQRHIAHVPQSIFLIDGSIAENIAFGVSPDQVDFERVRESATRAHLDKFIDRLPDGYSSRVGERGVRLSGGQRQRIGVARALYKKAEVLVLDEATSALDETTEKSVMATMDELDKEITILVVAHRLGTLDGCDMLVQVQDGRVVVEMEGSQES